MSPASKYSPRQQEAMVLEAAAKCIEETSLLDFTMAKIANKAGLSMGSIYKHVQSKEDILLALATLNAKQHHKVFTEIMSLPLTTPERLIADFLVSREKLDAFPFGVYLEMLVGNEAVVQRASSRWIETYARDFQSISEVFSDAVKQSWADGELMVARKDRDRMIGMLLLSLWSMSVGFTQVVYQSNTWKTPGADSALPFPLDPSHALIESAKRLINTLSWQKPLDENGIFKTCTMLSERGYR